jgi:hypothetical protein
MYYTYIYHDADGSPYYVGKGSKRRAYVNHGRVPVPPQERILIQAWESEAKAFEMERAWILLLGRQDLGTGVLLNQDEGGRAPSKRTSRKGGRAAVESGHLARVRVKGGITAVKSGQLALITPLGGRVQGRINAANGHLSRIGKLGGRVTGSINGRKAVESGQLASVRPPSATLNHTRWHVNRNIVSPICSLCQAEHVGGI